MNQGKIKKLYPDAIVPTYGSEQAAGIDLYAYCPQTPEIIKPGQTVLIHTGIAIEPPVGHVGLIFARSGLASKMGLRLANSVGVIDEDYRGEYLIALHNDDTVKHAITHASRIAQLIFIPYEQTQLIEVKDLTDTTRGAGGFGSTGTH